MGEPKDMFFFDTETSGLDPKRHGIIQIAWSIEVKGAVMDEQEFDLTLAPDQDICLSALEVNNFTLDRIKRASTPYTFFERMFAVIKNAVGGKGPLIPCGHNVRFDVDFLYALAQRYNATYYLNFGKDSYISLRKPVCTLSMCHFLDCLGVLKLKEYKLASVCKVLHIDLDGAHDAMQDVRATRQLYHKLIDLYNDHFNGGELYVN